MASPSPVATTDGRINLAEGLEQMLDLLLGNADARVLDRKTDFVPHLLTLASQQLPKQ